MHADQVGLVEKEYVEAVRETYVSGGVALYVWYRVCNLCPLALHPCHKKGLDVKAQILKHLLCIFIFHRVYLSSL